VRKMLKGKSKIIILIMLAFGFICLFGPGSYDAAAESEPVHSLDTILKHVYTDSKYVLTSPFRWERDDFLKLAALSFTTFSMMIVDEDFQEFVQRNRTSTTDRVARWTDKNTRRIINSGIAGLYLSGLVCRDHKMKETALLCLESVALAEGITRGLKYLVGRSRPYGGKGAFNYNPLEFPPPSYSLSLPSGHATAAFAFSSVVAAKYSSWLVKLVSYGFATTVSLGRINSNVHFLSDAFFGSIVGISVGRCLVHVHKKRQNRNGSVVFIRTHQGVGFRISMVL
jgi:membrane-associated PAP2 superfamily phosphatase